MAVYLITCGFVRAEIFAEKMVHLYEEDTMSIDMKHYFLYQHYPLKKEFEKAGLRKVCEKYNITWLDAGKDLGLHGGANYMMQQINPADSDVIIGHDPDDYADTKGWDKAIVDIVTQDPSIAIAYLNNGYNINHTPGCIFQDTVIAGHKVKIPTNRPTMMSISGYTAGWIRQIGGFSQPTTHYGHIESHFWRKAAQMHKKWAILEEYSVRYGVGSYSHDQLYTEYKQAQANFTSRESFEEWLKKKGLGHLIDG